MKLNLHGVERLEGKKDSNLVSKGNPTEVSGFDMRPGAAYRRKKPLSR